MKRVCTCEHRQQDQMHGRYVRVMNETNKGTFSGPTYRCTVCGREVN